MIICCVEENRNLFEKLQKSDIKARTNTTEKYHSYQNWFYFNLSMAFIVTWNYLSVTVSIYKKNQYMNQSTFHFLNVNTMFE